MVELPLGASLSHQRLVSKVGAGGRGEVYTAGHEVADILKMRREDGGDLI